MLICRRFDGPGPRADRGDDEKEEPMHVLAQAVATTNGTSEHWPSTYWLVLGIPLAFYMACATTLNAIGRSNQKNPVRYFFDSISEALERLTGIAGWAMAGALTGLLFLLVAAIGLYWDVAWHVDFGRDIGTRFTPPHVTILFGLGGLIFASFISIAFATAQEAPTKLRFGNLRVPYGGLLLGVMGLAAIAAFPLDNLWHYAYGLDVTLWSPTHLQLVTGGSMGTFAVVLLLAEALPFSKPKPFGRFWIVVACGAVLTAASTYQGEFDFRVPQFNPLYLPILTMAAAVGAAVLGAGFGKAFHRGKRSIPLGALGLAGAVLLATLFIPLPRDVGNVHTNIKLTPSADGKTGTVSVQVTPNSAAEGAIFFGVASWQGGGTKRVLLKETSPGVWTESTPIPIAGDHWKSMVALVKGKWNMAAPIYLPADPFIHAPAIPAVPERDVAMVRNTTLLLREAHGGPAWPGQLGFAGLALSVALLVGLMAYSASKIDGDDHDDTSYPRYDSGSSREPAYSSNRNGSSNGNGTWRPQPAPVPATRWNPGGLTRY